MAKKRTTQRKIREEPKDYLVQLEFEEDLAEGEDSQVPVEVPPAPERPSVPANWEHRRLHERVIQALVALPAHWRPANVFSGIPVTDLHTLAANLGAAIEDQVVETLNSMRPVWDPDRQYGLYRFVRQPQAFPDVLFCKDPNDRSEGNILFGIELKGWYLLAKEGEGNFRFKASPTACTDADLLVIVPWCLEHVTAGAPKVFTPYIESAKYAAEMRNWHWQYKMKGDPAKREIKKVNAAPYPQRRDEISDEAVHDKGGNFGRIFRTGIMDDYLKQIYQVSILGIPAWLWRKFFKVIEDVHTNDTLEAALLRLKPSLGVDDDKVEDLVNKIKALIHVWGL